MSEGFNNLLKYFGETPPQERSYLGYYNFRKQQGDISDFQTESRSVKDCLSILVKHNEVDIMQTAEDMLKNHSNHRKKYQKVNQFWTEIENAFQSKKINKKRHLDEIDDSVSSEPGIELAQALQKLKEAEDTNKEQKKRIKSLLAHIDSIGKLKLPWDGLSYGIQPDDIQWLDTRHHLGHGGYKSWELAIYGSISVAVGVTGPLETVKLFSNFVEELKIYQSLHHPGVILTYGGFIRKDDHRGVFITELANGDLESYIENTREPMMQTKLMMIYQLLDILKYIHGEGLIHGDLKASNVLIFYPSRENIPNLLLSPGSTVGTDKNTNTFSPQADHSGSPIPGSVTPTQQTTSLVAPLRSSPDLVTHTIPPPAPTLKITDFSTTAPIPSGYGSPTAPITHAEGFHHQSTLFVRAPESLDRAAPVPSADIYGFGFVVAGILLWKNSLYAEDVILRELEADLGVIFRGMVDDVKNRWDLTRIQDELDQYKLKFNMII